MEIRNKEAFKVELRKEIDKHMKEFPVFFYGNIIINIVLIAIIVAAGSFIALTLEMREPDILTYGLFFIGFILSILSVTMRSFFKNVRILSAIRAIHHDFDVDNYELDNLVGFIEQLPMKREEVERMKISLSYGKLINILDLFNIISCEKGIYDMDIIFEFQTEEAIGEEIK